MKTFCGSYNHIFGLTYNLWEILDKKKLSGAEFRKRKLHKEKEKKKLTESLAKFLKQDEEVAEGQFEEQAIPKDKDNLNSTTESEVLHKNEDIRNFGVTNNDCAVTFNALKIITYNSIILDTTPDASHVEQLSFVVRFVNVVNKRIEVCERFLGFFPITNTTGEGLYEYLTETLLPMFDLNLYDLRGQGYDNGSNMRGKHVGLQKRVLNVNP
ncbi:hypothetical protein ILUMI_22021 [Ignelater luminosus]|uniref:DUF4371 domain-containing protein n=1 Tax=Ignelater luminosus TaxID=2038154 RepID=A0A8K0CF74_IGNLU|nr:hypothetical protein ILUMI_22021 [Ignelater luminosus]